MGHLPTPGLVVFDCAYRYDHSWIEAYMTTQYLLLYIMPTNTVSISSVQVLRSQYYISLYQVSISNDVGSVSVFCSGLSENRVYSQLWPFNRDNDH